MATNDTPNPGSDAAVKQGCTCPVMDNGHGKGFLWDGASVFWINEGCPLHRKRKDTNDNDTGNSKRRPAKRRA
jgi:hypothetical protein